MVSSRATALLRLSLGDNSAMVIVVDPGGDKHAYQNGQYIDVGDGHLFIRDSVQGSAIGVFAPGKWQSAHVDSAPVRNAGVGGLRPRLGQ
jgi:hypothetical protein